MRLHESLSPHIEIVHFGLTSEDTNNLAYALMMGEIKQNCLNSNKKLLKKLWEMA